MGASEFPGLTHLDLWLGDEDYGGTTTVDELCHDAISVDGSGGKPSIPASGRVVDPPGETAHHHVVDAMIMQQRDEPVRVELCDRFPHRSRLWLDPHRGAHRERPRNVMISRRFSTFEQRPELSKGDRSQPGRFLSRSARAA